MHTTTNIDTLASLHFIHGHILFECKEGKNIVRRCLSPDAVRNALLLREFDSGWIAPHIIRYGEGPNGPWVIQHYPAQTYTLHFDAPIAHHSHPPVSRLNIPLPAFLFTGKQRTYHIFAIRVWNNDHTTLYHAPIPNVSNNGAICYGNITPPIASPSTMQQAWQLFWNSQFNNDHATQKSRQYPENIIRHLHDIAQQALNAYPGTDLIRSRITIENILNNNP